MTWGEFKAAVEARGAKDDMELFEIHWDSFYDDVTAAIGADTSVSITGGFAS